MSAEIIELGVKVTSDDLRKAESQFDRTGAAAKRTQKAMNDAGTASQRMNRDVENLTRSMKQLIGAYFSIQTIRQLVAYSDTYKLMQGRIALVTKSNEELAATEARLADVALKTRTGYEATIQLYSRIALSSKQLGKSNEELLKITETVNKALQVGGASSAEASAGVIQLSQALAAGVLRGDEFRSVLENMPRVTKALEDGLGKTRGELIAMANEGQITSKMVADALLKASDQISKEYEKLPVTVGQAFTNLETSFIRYIGQSTVANTATSALAEAMGVLAENLTGVIDGLTVLLGLGLIVWLARVAKGFSILNAVMAINPWIALGVAIAAIIVYFGGMEKVLISLEATFVWLWSYIEKFGISMVNIGQAIYEGFGAAFQQIGEIVKGFAADLKNFVENPLDGISFDNFQAAWAKGLSGAFKEAYNTVREQNKASMDQIDKETEAKLQALGERMRQIEGQGDLPPLPQGGGGAPAAGGVSPQRAKELAKAKELLDDYLQSLKDETMLAGMTAKEREKIQAILTIERRLKQQNVQLDQASRDAIIKEVEQRQQIEEMIKTQQKIAEDMADSFKDGLKSIFKDGSKGMKDMLSKWEDMLYDWISDTITKNFFKPIFDALAGGLSKALGSAASAGGGGGFFSSIFSSIGSLFGFADGGSGVVGGVGGVDSQVVKFRATPGEQVFIKRRGEQIGGDSKVTVIVNNNSSNSTTRQEERNDGMGGKTIEVWIDDVVSRNLRTSGTKTRQAMKSEFGASERLRNA